MKKLALIGALAAGALLVAPMALAAPSAPAAPGKKTVNLTAEQLTAAGFTVAPNTTAWGAPVTMSAVTEPQWKDIVVRGKAPDTVPIGQTLTMERFYATTTTGTGTFKPLNITATVGADHLFAMHVQLGYPGLWGYRVGYLSGDPALGQEFVGFQFQFTTTGGGKPAPSAQSNTVVITSKELAKAGFTKVPNVVGWGGTAAITKSKAKAGTPITLSGKAPREITAGQILTLNRFVPTDNRGSGHFEAVSGALAAVQADGSYSLTMELDDKGVYGYTVGVAVGEEWVGVEFQVKTT
jgi:hypothetical protein